MSLLNSVLTVAGKARFPLSKILALSSLFNAANKAGLTIMIKRAVDLFARN